MKRYLLAFALVFMITLPVALAITSFRSADVQLLRKAYEARPTAVYLLGNSVIDHSSKCDKDHRSIAAMLSAAMGTEVVDMSKGGMQFSEYTDIVSLLSTKQNAATLVVPLVPDMTDEAYWHRNDDIFRHLGYSAASFRFPTRLKDLVPVKSPVNIDNTPQVFEGRRYGTAKEIQTRFMAKEKAATACPEIDALDADFFRYSHWRQASRIGPSDRFASELHRINQVARDQRWQVIYVLMPLNKNGYERTGEALSTQKIQQIQAWMVTQLAMMGADFIDLTDSVKSSSFVDRWCACGHLGDDGRQVVALALAKKLKRSE